ncbi:MAG TPA: response regulator [Mycobacteriales bacterium]|nr:response regulator [Mycobacteriales bacterium]
MIDEAAPVRILLVEDSPGDVSLTRESLRDARVANELVVVGDGEEALRFLRREDEHADGREIDLVLLDLNLPCMDGHEVLAEIKRDQSLRATPVIVLTTSANPDDVMGAYAAHANAYVTKPVLFADFHDVLRRLEGFWLDVVRLPREVG